MHVCNTLVIHNSSILDTPRILARATSHTQFYDHPESDLQLFTERCASIRGIYSIMIINTISGFLLISVLTFGSERMSQSNPLHR
jgi:hypothetical protein